MVDLDDAGDPVADELRDRMDPIWLKLTPVERAALDNRDGDPSRFAGHIERRDLSVRRGVREQFWKRAA